MIHIQNFCSHGERVPWKYGAGGRNSGLQLGLGGDKEIERRRLSTILDQIDGTGGPFTKWVENWNGPLLLKYEGAAGMMTSSGKRLRSSAIHGYGESIVLLPSWTAKQALIQFMTQTLAACSCCLFALSWGRRRICSRQKSQDEGGSVEFSNLPINTLTKSHLRWSG